MDSFNYYDYLGGWKMRRKFTSCEEETTLSEGLGREAWIKLKLNRRAKVKSVTTLDIVLFF